MTRVPRRWIAVGLVAAAILAASTIPLDPARLPRGPGPVGVDAWLHAAGFAVLAVTLWNAFTATRPATATTAAAVLIAGIAYGAGIEVLQTAIPTRGFEAADIVADAAGAALGVPLWRLAAGLRGRVRLPSP